MSSHMVLPFTKDGKGIALAREPDSARHNHQE